VLFVIEENLGDRPPLEVYCFVSLLASLKYPITNSIVGSFDAKVCCRDCRMRSPNEPGCFEFGERDFLSPFPFLEAVLDSACFALSIDGSFGLAGISWLEGALPLARERSLDARLDVFVLLKNRGDKSSKLITDLRWSSFSSWLMFLFSLGEGELLRDRLRCRVSSSSVTCNVGELTRIIGTVTSCSGCLCSLIISKSRHSASIFLSSSTSRVTSFSELFSCEVCRFVGLCAGLVASFELMDGILGAFSLDGDAWRPNLGAEGAIVRGN